MAVSLGLRSCTERSSTPPPSSPTAHPRLRGQTVPGRRRHPLRAALVQALAAGRPRRAEAEAASATPIGDLFFGWAGSHRLRICGDPRGGPPGAATGPPRRRRPAQPSASHFAFGKRRCASASSRGLARLRVTYVYANHVGNEAGRAIYDGGPSSPRAGGWWRPARASPSPTARSPAPWSTSTPPRTAQARTGSSRPISARTPRRLPARPTSTSRRWSRGTPRRPAALGVGPVGEEGSSPRHRARALRLRPQEPLARLRGLALGRRRLGHRLPGVADGQARRRRAGHPRFVDKLPARRASGLRRLPAADRACSPGPQPTENSGSAPRRRARAVADCRGARLPAGGGRRPRLRHAGGSRRSAAPLDWQHDDVALQNIQARAAIPVGVAARQRRERPARLHLQPLRGGGRLRHHGRRHQRRAGPIAGIDKAWLPGCAGWRGPAPTGCHPIAAWRPSIPPAHRRAAPARRHQTDEDDLALRPPSTRWSGPPSATSSRRSRSSEVRPPPPQHGAAQLGLWVERFFRLFAARQWKRELRPVVPPRRREPRSQRRLGCRSHP